jgi:hypothetical protein
MDFFFAVVAGATGTPGSEGGPWWGPLVLMVKITYVHY